MGKGTGRFGKKASHYPFKKRCCEIGCNHKAKYIIDNKYYCKEHYKLLQ